MCRSEVGRKTCRSSHQNDIHAICQDRNSSAATVHKLVNEAGAELLERKDVYGRVPLYYAIRSGNSSLVSALFDARPEAILEPDFCGDLPLYMLFRDLVDPRLLEHVLNKKPSLAFFVEQRFSGSQTLLQMIYAEWIKTVRKQASLKHNRSGEIKENNNNMILSQKRVRSDGALLRRWTKLVLMVRAAHRVVNSDRMIENKTNFSNHGANNNNSKSESIPLRSCKENVNESIPELHLALQLDCLPEAIVGQFIELYPEQASLAITVASRTKFLPLHYFLRNESMKTARSFAAGTTAAAETRVQSTSSTSSTILRDLVRAFPQAASIRAHTTTATTIRRGTSIRSQQEQSHNSACGGGALPLHLAIAKRSILWKDGIEELVYANPSALAQKDPATHLVPFLQQAVLCANSTNNSATTLDTTNHPLSRIYCLLREDPSVLTMVAK